MPEIVIYLALILPFLILYYLRNKEAKWLWLFFTLTLLSNGVMKFDNPALSAERVVLLLASLIMAITKSRSQKKNA